MQPRLGGWLPRGGTSCVAARRKDRVEEIADEVGGTALELDVRDLDSIEGFASN